MATDYEALRSEMDSVLDGAVKKHYDMGKARKRILVAAAAGATVLAAAAGGYAASTRESAPAEYVPGEFLVKFEDAVTVRYDAEGDAVTGLSDVDRLNEMLSGEQYEQVAPASDEHELDNWYVVDINDSLDLESWMERFESTEGVEIVGYNGIMTTQYEYPELSQERIEELEAIIESGDGTAPNDPLYHSEGSWRQRFRDMYGLYNTDAAGAWELTTGSPSIIVAVVDTGVDYNHPDIAGRTVPGFDFVNNDDDPMDDQGHGTHVAGTIAARTNNGIGVAGATWQTMIMPVKVLSASGSGSYAQVAAGIAWAADHDAHVINMSLGGPAGSGQRVVDEAIQHASDEGTIVVVAAGNNNGDAMGHTPANNPHVITVGATDYQDHKASFSNWGKKVDVSAPGVEILSLLASQNKFGGRAPVIAERYTVLSGTSMATPHVAADVALILAANPELIGDEDAVREVVRAGVDEFETQPPKPIGTGRINYRTAVEEARDH